MRVEIASVDRQSEYLDRYYLRIRQQDILFFGYIIESVEGLSIRCPAPRDGKYWVVDVPHGLQDEFINLIDLIHGAAFSS